MQIIALEGILFYANDMKMYLTYTILKMSGRDYVYLYIAPSKLIGPALLL